MKKILLILLLLSNLFSSDNVVNEKTVKELLKSFSKKLPMKLDKYMTLDRVEKKNKDILYYYISHHKMSKQEFLMTQFIFDQELCYKDSSSLAMIKEGYRFISVYLNERGEDMFSVPTIYEDCLINAVQGKYLAFLNSLTEEELKEFNPTKEPYSNNYSSIKNK